MQTDPVGILALGDRVATVMASYNSGERMTTMQAVNSNIIFQFVDETTLGRFVNQHHMGILISSLDVNQSSAPRWGRVTHVGPGVSPEVTVGEYVLIEAGKWTRYFEIDGERYWKTDDQQVLFASPEPYTTY